jgi:hypothetical protein
MATHERLDPRTTAVRDQHQGREQALQLGVRLQTLAVPEALQRLTGSRDLKGQIGDPAKRYRDDRNIERLADHPTAVLATIPYHDVRTEGLCHAPEVGSHRRRERLRKPHTIPPAIHVPGRTIVGEDELEPHCPEVIEANVIRIEIQTTGRGAQSKRLRPFAQLRTAPDEHIVPSAVQL